MIGRYCLLSLMRCTDESWKGQVECSHCLLYSGGVLLTILAATAWPGPLADSPCGRGACGAACGLAVMLPALHTHIYWCGTPPQLVLHASPPSLQVPWRVVVDVEAMVSRPEQRTSWPTNTFRCGRRSKHQQRAQHPHPTTPSTRHGAPYPKVQNVKTGHAWNVHT
jgi:hypothetical protein